MTKTNYVREREAREIIPPSVEPAGRAQRSTRAEYSLQDRIVSMSGRGIA